MAILIDAAQTVHTWVGASYTDKKKFFDELERSGLGTVIINLKSNGVAEAGVKLTPKGINIIESIGMTVPQNVTDYYSPVGQNA